MLFYCCLKGELAVVHILVLVLFSASRIVLPSDTCLPHREAWYPKSSVPGLCDGGLFAFKG